ncbi:hypothetical protein [Streptomyces rhizosphaerihabitans]|uniref:hypothetical protein n=1 Tax=Streptomyces rhizosphaerihabitans TaxID=1266770 RepID=UPI0021BF9B81|nr:hypothetical protein [Streptomyces rhizosphaerihabitans]MCT9005913.1 hypothetical protein [Streptomyces rhizosphaerihabitans]
MSEWYVLAVDTGHTGALREADHLLRALAVELGLRDDVLGCTHHVRDGRRPHTALSFAVPSERAARAAWSRLTENGSGGSGTRSILGAGAGAGAGVIAIEGEGGGGGAGTIPDAGPAPLLGVAFGDERHGPDELAAGAAHAAAEHTARSGGRAVLYPGADALTGVLTVARLLEVSAVEQVAVLGSPEGTDPERQLVTRDHVRPQWSEGRLVLAAMPAAGGTLVPFEVPDPTPCCADH